MFLDWVLKMPAVWAGDKAFNPLNLRRCVMLFRRIMTCTVLAGLMISGNALALLPGEDSACLNKAKCYAYLELENGEPGQEYLGSFELEHNCYDGTMQVCAPWNCQGDSTTQDTWQQRCRVQFDEELKELEDHPLVKRIQQVIVGFPDIPF